MLSRDLFSTSMARSKSALCTVKVMSVKPSSDTFCTIMSTLMLAAASGPNTPAATPGLSATLSSVTWIETRPHQTPHALLHGKLARAVFQHLVPLRGHLQHLFIGDSVKPMG